MTNEELESENARLKTLVSELRQVVYELTRNEMDMRKALERAFDYVNLNSDQYLSKYGVSELSDDVAVALQLPNRAKLQEIQDAAVSADDTVRGPSPIPTGTLAGVLSHLAETRSEFSKRVSSR
jgi:hypothetical protein